MTGGGVAVLAGALRVGAKDLITRAALCDARAVVTDSGLRRVACGLDPGWVTGHAIERIGTDHPVRIGAPLLRAAIDTPGANYDAFVVRSGRDAKVLHAHARGPTTQRVVATLICFDAHAFCRQALPIRADSSAVLVITNDAVRVGVRALIRLDGPTH